MFAANAFGWAYPAQAFLLLPVAVLVQQVVEEDAAQDITPFFPRTILIEQVIESDVAQTISVRYTPSRNIAFLPSRSGLGSGEYQCFITDRGGGRPRFEVAFSQLSIEKVLDDAGSATLNLPDSGAGSAASCCEVIAKTEPWRDELLIYRNNDVAFVGPVVRVTGAERQLVARDLFHWAEVRLVEEDLHFYDDYAFTFRALFEYAMSKDPSANVSVVAHATGDGAVRSYQGKDVPRVADLIREIARTAVDFTTIERTVYVGGPDIFPLDSQVGTPLLLHDEGVMSVAPDKDGSRFATEFLVFAGSAGTKEQARNEPLVGKASRQSTTYGLVQRAVTELQIKDLDSANASALSHLEAVQPAPFMMPVTFSPEAAFEFKEIIPGRRVDCRISESASCIEVVGIRRLVNASISVGPEGESISGNISPVGLTEEELSA